MKNIFLAFSIFFFTSSLLAYNEIKITEEEIKLNGITLIRANTAQGSDGILFNAFIDFDDKMTSAQNSSYELVVTNINKKEGERVKKGEIICEVISDELSTLFFEFKNTREHLKIAKENEQKDKMLYEKGVISQREYQLSYLTMNELQLKYNETRSKLQNLGLSTNFMDSGTQGQYGFPIVAKESGILSAAPRQVGQKINAFTPYIRISSENSSLLGRIRIPVGLAKAVEINDEIMDKDGRIIGILESISVVVDKDTNSVIGVAKITSGNYKVGELVDVYIGGKLPDGSIFVPSSCVVKMGNDHIVFARTKNGFLPIKVEITEERTGGFGVKKGAFPPTALLANSSTITLQGMLSGLGGSNAD